MNNLWLWFTEFLQANQFASGGILLGIFGATLVYARKIPLLLWMRFEKTFCVWVEVRDDNALFKGIEKWAAQAKVKAWRRNFLAKIDKSRTANSDNPIYFTFGHGKNFFFYGFRLVIFSRQREELSAHAKQDVYYFQFFTKNIQVVEKFLLECYKSNRPTFPTISVYVSDGYSWDTPQLVRKRPSHQLILPENQYQNLVLDLEKFLKSEEAYHQLGIPYRRGYLFSGSPGNGKTMTILSLASDFNIPVYIIPSIKKLSQQELVHHIQNLAKPAFLVFEDIDTLLNDSRKSTQKEAKFTDSEGNMNFGELLNALDGITTPEGYVTFMTTNAIETLDPALTRPGRIDQILEFNNANEFQAEQMYLKFFPNDLTDSQKFAKVYGRGEYSVCQIQEILITMMRKHAIYQ